MNEQSIRRATRAIILVFFVLPGLLFVDEIASTAKPSHSLDITLKNAFIQHNMDAVTISTGAFEVDFTRPHQPIVDGDMHIAGRSADFGLPTVAEIMNVKFERAAATVATNAKGGDPIALTGVWRLWSEHANGANQVQGKAIPSYADSNPDHVFEIHPITKIGSVSLLGSLNDIAGYPAHDGDQAFPRYDSVDSKITFDDATTTISTTSVPYNYARFWIAPVTPLHQTEGGTWALAQLSDDAGKILEQKKRVFFVGGSPEEDAVKSLPAGKRIHVLGIPRIDLSLVWYRRVHSVNNPDILTWKLPYEMIIVGLVK